ncbi:hypothetical protein SAMN04487969_12028 [Paenibacillus algorifonticola]|uniref:Uncharacterized protein n=1 Tax=Paenibacillus algorifonticola TaxID=684063 RepID=A0A1I2H5D4_9BACL|nr:hypothetical protein [Paenibacillus algorifonticola]SFF24902.1 hypothetical protein SAMN04487969_12028 [Paenibacillus algorifonticola]
MKQWRVGTLSMGITLLLMGVAVAVSIWSGTGAYNMLLWVAPLVFILLGAEILLYIWFAGSERTTLRYDWISLFIVGMIGSFSLAMAGLISTGILDELRGAMRQMERTALIETAPISVPEKIDKIVVQALRPVSVDQVDGGKVQLLGQVQYWAAEPIDTSEQLISTSVVGTVMYVMVGEFERHNGPIQSNAYNAQMTLILPKSIKIEQRGF